MEFMQFTKPPNFCSIFFRGDHPFISRGGGLGQIFSVAGGQRWICCASSQELPKESHRKMARGCGKVFSGWWICAPDLRQCRTFCHNCTKYEKYRTISLYIGVLNPSVCYTINAHKQHKHHQKHQIPRPRHSPPEIPGATWAEDGGQLRPATGDRRTATAARTCARMRERDGEKNDLYLIV